MNYKFDQRIFS